jgi:serine/threonine protein kinase
VHRDVKPANLLVDRHGVVKILDMGLAKFAGARSATAALVNDEQVLGTADFVAPEQTVNSNTVDSRADIYSPGCTLYFLLSGHPPFPFGNALQRMAAHQHNTPPSITLDRPETPAGLVAICERMMAKSPADRYAAAGEVHAALTTWLKSGAAAVARNHSMAAAAHGGSHGDRTAGFIPMVDQRGGDSNVHGSNEPARADSPFADTDPNLQQATQRIPTSPAGVEPPVVGPSQSHVLHSELARMTREGSARLDSASPPPPIVIPPAPTPPVIVRPVQSAPRATITPPIRPGDDAPLAPLVRPAPSGLSRDQRSSAAARWFTAVLLTALGMAAIVLAIIALA